MSNNILSVTLFEHSICDRFKNNILSLILSQSVKLSVSLSVIESLVLSFGDGLN